MKIPPADTKEYKEYFEVKLGGGHPNSGLEKYLYNDRKVLSFRVLWDDQTLEGMVNFFVLNYFLADDSVEVKEIVKQNSGKDPFPLLLHRGKLPKVPIMTHYPVFHYYYCIIIIITTISKGMTLKKEEYYTKPEDLICG